MFEELEATGPCGGEAVLLSSGASGGSVGLSLFRDSKPGGAFARAESIAQSPALTAGVSGLMVGDVVAGSTGLQVPTDGYLDKGAWTWQDRAAHIQWEWAQAARESGDTTPPLLAPYDHIDQSPTGWLALNVTAAGYDCRALISQLDLDIPNPTTPAPDGGTAIPNCKGDQPGVANVIDLEQLYGDCPFDMDWATAAMTSARFPIITPAGRTSAPGVPACDNLPDLQLADGGIAENSGLGTLSDIAPELAHLVAEKNANADGVSVPIIVPIVLYISNAPGRDVTAATAGFSSELGVALSQGSSQAAQNSDRAWLQRISGSLQNSCPTTGSILDAGFAATCASVSASIRASLGDGVAVIAPRSTPAISAPLGWALSDLSLCRIDQEVANQRDVPSKWPSGYGGLSQLRALLTPDPDAVAGFTGSTRCPTG